MSNTILQTPYTSKYFACFSIAGVLFTASILTGGQSACAQQVIAPTSSWTAIRYANQFATDPSADQQTGTPESDLVGNATHATLYTAFDKGSLSSLTDGTLYFRARVGADSSPAGFKGNFFVGIDADRNGSLDLFVGVNNSGNADSVAIWNPGTGANTSPKTTSIVSPPLDTFTLITTGTVANYAFGAVTSTNNPGATNFDINADGNTDQFLSFGVPFSSVTGRLAARNIFIDENTSLRFVLATATQDNSLNQDIGGINGGVNSTATYDSLGALTDAYNLANGTFQPVPTPPSAVSLGIGGVVLLGQVGLVRFRSRHRSKTTR